MIAFARQPLRSACLGLMLFQAGCASYSPPQGDGGAEVREPPPTVVTEPASPPPAAQPPQVSAHRALLDKARLATESGDYETALALLERAQRIEPDNAEIYLELARTHRARGDLSMARATAERGLLYCRGRSVCDALRAFTQ